MGRGTELKLIENVKIYFTPGRYGGPFVWTGPYRNEKNQMLVVGLCSRPECSICGKVNILPASGLYEVDLQIITTGKLAPTGVGNRKYCIAHNSRPVRREEKKPQTSEITSLDDIKLPSVEIIEKKDPEIINLGHRDRVGSACFAYDDGRDVVIVDCGTWVRQHDNNGEENGFHADPEELPNMRWIEENYYRIRAIVITHGHLDHINAIPYLPLNVLEDVPVYATRFAGEMIKRQCRLNQAIREPRIESFQPGETLKFGKIEIQSIPVAHSTSETCAFVISLCGKRVVHFTDAKFNGIGCQEKIALTASLHEIGEKPVDLLAVDVVNAREKDPEFTPQENIVFESLWDIVEKEKNAHRIFVTFFATNVARMKALMEIARACGRNFNVRGRAMEDIYEISKDIGLVPAIAPIPNQTELVCVTGCQAERGSYLYRAGLPQSTEIRDGDVVIISSRPIPGTGNDRRLQKLIIDLCYHGAKVYVDSAAYSHEFLGYSVERKANLHVSGHGHQGDLKLLLELLKPKAVMPVHADLRAQLAFGRLLAEHKFRCQNLENIETVPIETL